MRSKSVWIGLVVLGTAISAFGQPGSPGDEPAGASGQPLGQSSEQSPDRSAVPQGGDPRQPPRAANPSARGTMTNTEDSPSQNPGDGSPTPSSGSVADESAAAPSPSRTASVTGGSSVSGGAPPPVQFIPDVQLEIAAQGDPLRFDTRVLVVYVRQTVLLTLSNRTDPEDRLMVDWALVDKGRKLDALVYGAGAGPEGAEDEGPAIMARTRRIGAGETAVVAFEAPEEPGRYPFVSTVGTGGRRIQGILEVRRVPG